MRNIAYKVSKKNRYGGGSQKKVSYTKPSVKWSRVWEFTDGKVGGEIEFSNASEKGGRGVVCLANSKSRTETESWVHGGKNRLICPCDLMEKWNPQG